MLEFKMKRLSIIALAVLPSFIFLACSTTPRICEPQNAREAGIAQAMRGEDFNPSAGAVCVEEHVNIFKTNFQAGYQEGRARYCTPATVEQAALAQGRQGSASGYVAGSYHICENATDLKDTYDRGYNAGLKEYCSETQAETSGAAVGDRGAPSAFAADKYTVCGKGRTAKAKAAYDHGYSAGLGRFCQGTGLEAQATQEGTLGAERADVSSRFQLCTAGQKKKLQTVYNANYEKGLAQFCSPAAYTPEAKAQAHAGTSAELPAKYQKCLAKQPALKTQYATIFAEERKRFIEAECTYQKGNTQGATDANASNTKNTAMPAFCDTTLFSVYLNGYLEGFKQTKDRLCDVNAAYQAGIAQGRSGASALYNAPANCPAEYQSALTLKFTEGYNFGTTQRVQLAAPAAGAVAGQQLYCRSSGECSLGQTCRNRGDGITMCLGNGARNYYCVTSMDCSSGLLCRDIGARNLRICN
jgi:hypothetical protein